MGWTQHDLALKTERMLSRSAIANIEIGRQRIAVHHIYTIAATLRIDPADLLPDLKDIPTGQDRGEAATRDAGANAFFEALANPRASVFRADAALEAE